MKKVVIIENGPKPIGAYSPAIEANGFVFVSGQVGADPADGKLVEGGVTAQTAQALRNMEAILTAAGLTMADVVKATVFLADIREFAAMNEAYKQVFQTDCPARSAFQVANLPGGAQVEIEAIAAR
ncbi:MAG: reactive intermediate/imine deaminase [Oscillospiraceae bacterium]|jgi:2-iminobutanoate/2-iminopropanoate deaminase|nr:reactive intermediate/imine deaminase [Oscillospiraceae bacterium]